MLLNFIIKNYPAIIVISIILYAAYILGKDMNDDSNWIDENDNPIPKEVIKHRREVEKTDKRLSKIYH